MNDEYSVFTTLRYLCQWNEPEEIKKILEQDESKYIDVTLNEGELFQIAALQDSSEVFATLVNYYKKSHSLNSKIDLSGENSSEKFQLKHAENKLIEIFINILDKGTILTDNIKEIITPYITHDNIIQETSSESECTYNFVWENTEEYDYPIIGHNALPNSTDG